MKLDRNTNRDGGGKYALLKLRILRELKHNPDYGHEIESAIRVLEHHGLIHWGNESPGEQFFVMKYKDAFTASALAAYARAALLAGNRLGSESLFEYSKEILNEAAKARAGNRIPD